MNNIRLGGGWRGVVTFAALALACVLGAGSARADEGEDAEELDGSKMVKLTVELSHDAASAGQGVWVGAVFEIEKGWHTYWRNAGDSGAAPRFEWTVEPAGALEIGSAEWMTPKRKLSEGDILDYIYEGRVTHFFPAKLGSGVKIGDTITITCKSKWLVCKDACMPGEGVAKATLRVGKSQESNIAPKLRAEREMVPMEKDELLPVAWAKGGEASVLEIKFVGGEHASASGTTLSYFPYAEEGDLVPANLLKGGASKSGTLRLRFDESELKKGGKVRGVVRVDSAAGTRAYLIEIPAER
ncbi:MAG: protein-disulfide reductase DsbD domain-containing protein [Phycisphaerales bacterium]